MQNNLPAGNSRQNQIKLPGQLEELNLGNPKVPFSIPKNPIVQRRETSRKSST